MAVGYRYIAKIKNIVNDGLFNGFSSFSFYATGDEAAQSVVQQIMDVVPNYPVYGLQRVIQEMPSDTLGDDANSFTDVFTYRFGMSDGQIMYLNVRPDRPVSDVISLLGQLLKDSEGQAISVKTMSMKGRNVVQQGSVLPPDTAIS